LADAIEEFTTSSDDEVDDIDDFAEAKASKVSNSAAQVRREKPKPKAGVARRPARSLSQEPAARVIVKDTPAKKTARVSFASSALSNRLEIPEVEGRRSVSRSRTKDLYVPESPPQQE
jgi:hypothetical protein